MAVVDTAVATVDAGGMCSGVATGSTMVSASIGSVSQSVTVNVQ